MSAMNFSVDIIQAARVKAVRDLLTAYFLWYEPDFEVPSVEHTDWLDKQVKLQNKLAATGMVTRIPVQEPDVNLTQSVVGVLESVKPIEHPLETHPVIKEIDGDYKVAVYIAQRLSRDETRRRHPVVFIEHSDAVSAFFSRSMSDPEVKEILTLSPVMVYYVNGDKRNIDRPINTLTTRQYGYCFIVRS